MVIWHHHHWLSQETRRTDTIFGCYSICSTCWGQSQSAFDSIACLALLMSDEAGLGLGRLVPADLPLWPWNHENMVTFSLFYTTEAYFGPIMFVSALKIVKIPTLTWFSGGSIFFFRGLEANLPTNPRSGNLGPVPPCSWAGISLGISLFAGWDIIGLSLLMGRDIIGDIIVCWVGYHRAFITHGQGYHWGYHCLLGGIS